MRIIPADIKDVPKLYQLQLLAFESEAAIIGSRDVPALQETEEAARRDFANWDTVKLEDDDGTLIGASAADRIRLHRRRPLDGSSRLSPPRPGPKAPGRGGLLVSGRGERVVHLYQELEQYKVIRKNGLSGV